MKAIVVGFTLVLAGYAFGAEEQYLTYDKFLRQVDAGNISSVTLDNLSTIRGVMVQGDVTNSFRSYGDVGSANDPLLNQLLKEHDVTIAIRDKSEVDHMIPMFSGFIFLGVPVVFLILLIVIIMKLNQILGNQRTNRQTPGAHPNQTADGPSGTAQE